MPGLIDGKFRAVGQADRREKSAALIRDVLGHVNSLASRVGEGGLDVIAHEIKARGGHHGRLGGRRGRLEAVRRSASLRPRLLVAWRVCPRRTRGPLRHERMGCSSGKLINQKLRDAALRFHGRTQLGCEVIECLVAGRQDHVNPGDCTAGGRVLVEIDISEVNGNGKLPAASDLGNRESYRYPRVTAVACAIGCRRVRS
jgi:hypothetical protein